MFDEMDRLRDSTPLQMLLTHYAELAAPDRHAWQDRRMALDELSARELTGLHGELIAYGWLEQNTGIVLAPQNGVVHACYRVTTGGLRALRALRRAERDSA